MPGDSGYAASVGVNGALRLAPFEDGTPKGPTALKPIFDVATRPIFTVYRRYALRGSNLVYAESDETTRMQAQLDLIDLESSGFDMELDTFDPHPGPANATDEGKRYSYDRESPPREVSHDPRAVDQQMRLIEVTHHAVERGRG